ncbi:MAG: VOC family protein [Promethearchaeota archaeon]|jgi:catechol 2,3-dioxygenase-like lactoylglutathione lyase family enzyme
MNDLPWHHVHVTTSDREATAHWHEKISPVKRGQPTKRSENLYWGPNLLQVQSTKVAPEPREGQIDSIGIGVINLDKAIEDWQSAGGSIDVRKRRIVKVKDPWGVPFELVEMSRVGYTHINITTATPEQLRDWYESNLGGERIMCEWDSTRIILAYDSMLIAFIPIVSPISSIKGRSIDHLGWYTTDLDEVFLRMSKNGIHFPVVPRKFGSVRLAFAEDLSGNWIELLEPPDGIVKKPI